MNTLRNFISEFAEVFGRLTPRERRLVALAALAVFLFTLYLVMHSFSSTAQSYKEAIKAETQRLGEAQKLEQSYREAESKRMAAEQQLKNSNVRLISYIEEKGTAAGLSIPTIYPKSEMPLGESNILENTIEVTLTDIKLDRLVKFLSSVESGPGIIKVTQLRIEPRIANETLTAWVTVASYRMKP